MKSFFEYVRERGIDIPEKEIPGDWFSKHGYPMVVRHGLMMKDIPTVVIVQE